MVSRFATHFLAGATLVSACVSDEDCSLNGICGGGGWCVCDAFWQGEDCGRLAVVAGSARRIFTGEDQMSTWGGLPVWDEETQRYQLFASEFARGCGLNQWSPNSQVIRAEAADWRGPYEKKEVVLPAFRHNPTITRAADGTWLLYVIGRDVPDSELIDCNSGGAYHLGDPAPGNKESNITLFSSRSLLGPWQDEGVVLAGDDGQEWDADRTNPSAHPSTDGSVHLMYRGCGLKCGGGEYMGMSIAPRWKCSVDVPGGCRYERKSLDAPLWHVRGEDPFLFRDSRGGWHALLHNLEPNGGFGCDNATWRGCDVGGHAFSRDGLAWSLSSTVAYTTNISWADGSDEVLNRRERPQLVMAPDSVTPVALTNGAQSRGTGGSFTVIAELQTDSPIATITSV